MRADSTDGGCSVELTPLGVDGIMMGKDWGSDTVGRTPLDSSLLCTVAPVLGLDRGFWLAVDEI